MLLWPTIRVKREGKIVRLLSMSLENFRSYKGRTVLNVGDFTAIMGRNDVGKSTLLEALEIFFNNQIIKIEQGDPCVHNEGSVVEIGCIFDDLPKELTLDARSVTTLAAEHLLNSDGNLEIVKRFDCRTKVGHVLLLALRHGDRFVDVNKMIDHRVAGDLASCSRLADHNGEIAPFVIAK